MFTVYILYSKNYDKTYVGFTSDLTSRFKSHNELGTKGYTMKFRPWTVLHTEVYENKRKAMKREKQLKAGQGRKGIREVLLKK